MAYYLSRVGISPYVIRVDSYPVQGWGSGRKLAPQRLERLAHIAEEELLAQLAEDNERSIGDNYEEEVPSEQIVNPQKQPLVQDITSEDQLSFTHPPSGSLKRDTPENGHQSDPASKWSNVANIFNSSDVSMEQTDASNGESVISEEQYKHYVEVRKACAIQARSELVNERFPGRAQSSLCKDEWATIQDDVNKKFGELLTVTFPENHFRLNCMYLKRKGDGKPP